MAHAFFSAELSPILESPLRSPQQASHEVLAAHSCVCCLTVLNSFERDTSSGLSMTINGATEFVCLFFS